jgi:plasmid stability protein
LARIAIPTGAGDDPHIMKTITLHHVGDHLLRKLEARAAANQRSLEDEAIACLQVTVDAEDELIGAISPGRWAEIEESVCEAIHDKGTPLTVADFEHYRGLARGGTRS